jgi:two-component system nitrogen regulation response regulator GlnG
MAAPDRPRGARATPVSQGTSTEMGLEVQSATWDTRVVGLTIVYHRDLDRVGERALCTGIETGRTISLSRHEPLFAAPGGRERRPLADSAISRTPLQLTGTPEDGSVVLDCTLGGMRVRADGRPVEGSQRLSRADIEHGVVLLLGGRVLLLLHLLEPQSDAGEPAFGLIGHSPAMTRVRRDIRRVADLAVPVLVRGASGSGKELVARAIHDASQRRDRPYVTVNLAAVPPALAASELFGAVKGAFTGAHRDRAGYFARAHGGTLFLDEIGETAPELQVLLLRTLESGEIQPVGADATRPVDVRVVSATDADLEAAIAAERFRAPLLYRLSGYVIHLPSLRERREDMGRLLVHFLRRELAAIGEEAVLDGARPEPWLPAAVVERLALYHWPGNVRQLANAVRHLVIANRGQHPAVHFETLDTLVAESPPHTMRAPAVPAPVPAPAPAPVPAPEPAGPPRPADITEDQLVAALRAHRFSPERAAAALGIPRSSIYRLMDRSARVRKASELDADEIRAARAQTGGDIEAMAALLEVSVLALRRRMQALAL